MKTESMAVGELLNDPANVRLHGARNLETIKASLARFGQQKPIVVDGNGVVVAGNGTLAAARELGWQSVHVVRSALQGADRTAYAIADNRTAELAEWDEGALAEQLSALAIDDEELLAAAGYEPGELEALADAVVGGGGEVVEDEAPEPPEDPVTKPGDLWQLGDHRVLCGDSTNAEDVARLMGGELSAMSFTDPPYGVKYRDTGSGAWDKKKLAKKKAGTLKPRFDAIKNDELNESELYEFLAAYMAAQRLAPSAAQYVCHASLRAHCFREALLETGYVIRAEIIWAKSRPGFNFANYKHKHEPIYYAAPSKGPCDWYGNNSQTTLWEVASESGAVYRHPTQKPVGLPSIAIRNSSRIGEIVFDPFLGSGTTLIAAEQLGRRCYGIEISPAYCDVIVERWENLTGGKAKRVADG